MAQERKHKRGDTREDGMVFWARCRGKEYWYTPEVFVKRREERNKKQKDYVARNKEPVAVLQKKYYEANKEELTSKAKRYRKNNKGRIASYLKQYRIDHKDNLQKKAKEYYTTNKGDILSKNNTYRTHRLNKDPTFRLAYNLRTRTRRALQGIGNNQNTMDLLGCTAEDARTHLENQFTDNMSWDNYGFYGWHVDHIIPVAAFDLSDPAHIKAAFHYTNLQPLWGGR